jgi:hypothetical protein
VLHPAALFSPAPAAAADRSSEWRTVAVTALDAYEELPVPVQSKAFTLSSALLATGTLYGWGDSRVPPLLAALMATRNPEGGWGLGYAYPAFDGTLNAATTTYTVTLAGHVGPALLAAWRAGALTDPEPLARITQLLMGTARYVTPDGTCIAVSRDPNDAGSAAEPAYCVHNINAGVADYLTQAGAAGFGRSGLQALVVAITRFEVNTYSPAWRGWAYQNTGNAVQDVDHGSYSAQSLYFSAYPIGREAAYQLLANPAVDDNGRRAHLRLPALPGGPGSMSRTQPGVTLWCELGDLWLAEAAGYVTASVADAKRLAQAAMLAALNSSACATGATP